MCLGCDGQGVKAQESVFGGKVADDFAVYEPGTVFDPNGKPFAVPVDSEHKATVFKPWTFGRPHMLSFHVNWSSFFITFVAGMSVKENEGSRIRFNSLSCCYSAFYGYWTADLVALLNLHSPLLQFSPRPRWCPSSVKISI